MRISILSCIMTIMASVLIAGCAPTLNEDVYNQSDDMIDPQAGIETEFFEQIADPLMTETEAIEVRTSTYHDCQYLINQTVVFTGTVMYSDCGKNCLGGCPNTGPSYCYYGVMDEQGCMVYIRNMIPAWTAPNGIRSDDIYIHKYQFGDNVEMNETVSLYTNSYCRSNDDEKIPQCSYLILGKQSFY